MKAPRLYVAELADRLVAGALLPLPRAAAHHAANVLRLRAGDALTLFTGGGGQHAAQVAAIDRRGVTVAVGAFAAIERESPRAATLVQAVIAADTMDLVVRGAVELGAAAIVPVLAARSQRGPAERIAKRRAHWRRIAIGACEQCGRNRVPEVHDVRPFSAWLDEDPPPTAILLAQDAAPSLAQAAREAAPRAVVIGPEGGFTPAEVAAAVQRGLRLAHLGARTLRAETAALAALATIEALAAP
jgi:16S rRNA (uracil1498-N3)-methyltransferase